jgi:hypothetical protein
MPLSLFRPAPHRSRARLIALTVLLLAGGLPGAVGASPVYDSRPAPLPPNVPSLGFEANGSSEFGDLIQFAGTNRTLAQVTLVMSDGALAANFPAYPGAGGPTWSDPLTLNLYNVDNSGPNPAPGTLIATRTQAFAIPWRPVADPTCANPSQWRASDGNCYSGLAFNVTFDFTGTVVPNQIIYGLAFNTQNHGYAPIGAPGPYDSLNQGLAQVPPSLGSNPFPDTAYVTFSSAGSYADGGAGGVGIFRRDTGWTPFSGAIGFDALDPAATAVPTLSPLGLLLLVVILPLSTLMGTRRASNLRSSD